MTEDFDRFLTSALAPPDEPDRQFVARVQAHIALEDRFAAEQRSLLRGFAAQLFGLLVVGAPVWWIARAAPSASWFGESPALGLAILLTGFIFLLVVLSFRPADRIAMRSPL